MREKRFAFVLAAALCAVSVGALAGCSAAPAEIPAKRPEERRKRKNTPLRSIPREERRCKALPYKRAPR